MADLEDTVEILRQDALVSVYFDANNFGVKPKSADVFGSLVR